MRSSEINGKKTANFYFMTSARVRSFSGQYFFSACRLNKEIHSVNLRVQPECRKIMTRKFQNGHLLLTVGCSFGNL